MAFTPGNDLNILQATDSLNVGALAGDDKYILSETLLDPGQTINITDAGGNNTLQLIGGTTIVSSIIAANALQLVLGNGAIVNIFGADSFSYEIGGNPLTRETGTLQDFSTFATTSLGASAVPTTGTVNGAANVQINANGTTTIPDPVVTVDLQEGTTDPVTATEDAEVFSFDIAAAKALTDDTQISIGQNDPLDAQIVTGGFDVANDRLLIDSETNLGATTLDQLNGVDGISVQENVITNQTLINFGADADGQPITVTLAGIVDPSLVNIDVF